MSEDTVLIVDDEPNVVSALRRVFMDDPFTVLSAGSGAEGLEVLKAQPVKVVISDEKMPVMSGAEFLAKVRRDYPAIIRIMLTGHASIEAAMKAINEGEIYRFFTKPWSDLELRFAVRSAIEKFNLEEENKRLLATVRKQAIDLKLLEKEFPGITQISRDDEGRVMIAGLSDEEMARIIAECEKEL